MSMESSRQAQDDPEDLQTEEQAVEGSTVEGEEPAPIVSDEPIEAEFEPADSPWKRLAEREVTMPIALALAAAAAVLGGFLGVALDGGGRSVSPGELEAAIDRRLAPLEELRADLRRAIAEGGGEGVAAAALSDLETELASLREEVGAAQGRLRAVETAGGSGEAGAALADDIEALRREVGEARRIAEAAQAAPAARSAEIEALTARIDTLDETVAAQGRALEQLSAASSELAGRVTGVPAPVRLGGRSAGATLAYDNLQEAARSGGPFVREAAAAESYFGESEHMQTLLRHAETGAPTAAQLAQRFRSAARAARAAEHPTGGGIVDRLGRAVAGLVTVRRLDAPETDAVPDVLVRAQRRLANDDLAGAAAELARLEGPAGEAVAPWVAQARARAEIEASLDGLRSSFTEH